VLHWQDNPEGAAAMTDPDARESTQTDPDAELPVEELDAVTGGARSNAGAVAYDLKAF
jgi:hypothetical protein